MNSFVSKLNQNNILIFDGIGAILSALLTGLILPNFSDLIGLSKSFLYALACLPVVYSVFSFSCSLIVKKIKPWMLLSIIIANLFYCILSVVIMVVHPDINRLGRGVLTYEIVIICFVLYVELKIYRSILKNK